MATTTFKIRKGRKKSTVYLQIQKGREFRLRHSTNFSIDNSSLKYWDSKRGRIKNLSNILDAEYINERLYDIDKKINDGIYDLYNKKMLDKLSCNKLIESVLNNKKTKQNKNRNDGQSIVVCEYFNWYLNFYSINPSSFSKSNLKKGTLKNYRNAKCFLERYLNYKKIPISDFTFNHINRDFYNDYLAYAKNQNLSNNYIGTLIQKLKTIVGSAFNEGIHNNNEFQKPYFFKMTEKVNNIYLDSSELEKITKVPLDNKLDNIRDSFLISCYCGMRVGDLISLLKNPNDKVFTRDKKRYIQYVQSKTGKEVEIPLKKEVVQILKKRSGNFPKPISSQKMNELIKVIGKRAGITSLYTKTVTKGGKQISETLPKFKFISMHTGRRSFCTNAYNSGIPLQFIMIASGHSSEKVLINYIKAGAEEKAKKLSEFEFFD